MKLIKSTLLCVGIATTLPLFAENIQIANGEFDNRELADNTSTGVIDGWDREDGLMGLFNPDHSVFPGEQGHGAHRNTLYMINSARVSQNIDFRTLQNSIYHLSFDVGQRADISMQNYTVTVTAGGETLMEVFNPAHASDPGSFTTAQMSFSNKDVVGEIIQLTIETDGVGHVHFDNFELHYEQTFKTPKESLRTVAYGSEVEYFFGSTSCWPMGSLTTNDLSATPYLSRNNSGPCSCYKSDLVFLDEDYDQRERAYTRYVKCVRSSED